MHKLLPSQSILQELFDYSIITGKVYRKVATARRHTIGEEVGARTSTGYLCVRVHSEIYFLHRLIWMLVTGEDPGEMKIDHIDKDRTNNSWTNLRLATHPNNIHNQSMHQDNECGAKGVRRTVSGRYQARIYQNGETINCGCYATVEEADQAYRQKEQELRGEFARPLDQI